MPSVLYIFDSAEHVAQVNDDARAVAQAESLDDAELRRVIDTRGITHVYLGAKGGKLTPQMLLQAGERGAASGIVVRPVYTNGSVWIFELAETETDRVQGGDGATR